MSALKPNLLTEVLQHATVVIKERAARLPSVPKTAGHPLPSGAVLWSCLAFRRV